MFKATKIKSHAAWGYGALFVVAYAGFLAYRYHDNREHPLAYANMPSQVHSLDAPALGHDMPRSQNVAHPSRVVVASGPVQNIQPVRTLPTATNEVEPAYQPPMHVDDMSAMSALMTDSDPEVARIARDAYRSMAAGQ